MFVVGRAVLRPLIALVYRPRVLGREHMPATGPVLLVSNHLSMLDTLVIPCFAPRRVQFLAKASLFRGAIGGWFFRSIGAVPVTRDASAGVGAALTAGTAILEGGGVFTVFPEGSRSRDGRLYRGKPGAAWLALETRATVVPVGLTGTHRGLRDPATGRRPRMQLRFGAPIELSDLTSEPAGSARRIATERIMAEIAELTGQTRVAEFAAGSIGA